MITPKDLNIALGSLIDGALKTAEIPAVRRRSDDESPVMRRSIQLLLEGLHIEMMGPMRKCTQDVVLYFYPEDDDHPRDEEWTAAMAVESALSAPLQVGSGSVYLDDEIYVDMSDSFAEMSFPVMWLETAEIEGETIEEIEINQEVD